MLVCTYNLLVELLDNCHLSWFLSASLQGGFHIDSSTQGKAICNDDMSVTALQQQLSEMKNKASGLESLLASGMQRAASPSVPAAHHAANTTGTHREQNTSGVIATHQ